MRQQMFDDTNPVAAIFVGGMGGIREEYELLAAGRELRELYPVGVPGGEASRLAQENQSALQPQLLFQDVYPSLFRVIMADLTARLG